MNCKPGDLAVIVRSHDVRNIGKFVRVLRSYPRKDSWWMVCQSVLHGQFSDWPAGAEVATYDAFLRPIRDPGDDARDESLAWLPPVPTEKPVTREGLIEALQVRELDNYIRRMG